MMSIFISLYFFILSLFSFMNNPLGYCMLLVISSMCVSSMMFFMFGSAWYAILLYLVYVGGVYMLFIFLSMHMPKTQNTHKGSASYYLYLFWLISEFCKFTPLSTHKTSEVSFYLCSGEGGLAYLFLGCFLMVGFIIVSFISSSKDKFMR